MRSKIVSLLTASALCATTSLAAAAPALRVSVTQRGDFVLLGNTLGYECAAGTPAPVVGTLEDNACSNQSANNANDSSPDLFWRADSPADGQALAAIATPVADARSTAVLQLPAGATVTHAFLYWAATAATNVADPQITFERIGAGAFAEVVTADQSYLPSVNNAYQSVADVTARVQQAGAGAYRISGIGVTPFANVNNSNVFGGWSMVVLYERAADPLRNLTIFDGLDAVSTGNPQTAVLSGFRVPNAGFTGKLGVLAYEGDNTISGDSLFFNGGAALSDAQNPVGNFFNGTRSALGAAVSLAGDLPQLTGTPQSYAGVDLDVVDITAKLTAGQTSATIQATSTGDVYLLGAFVTSISTFVPELTQSTKTVTDVNGAPTLAGDVLEYTITVNNTGNDTAVNAVVIDPLPAGVTYVPGSIVDSGGARTDAAGDDVAEYSAATRTVTVRVGTGANAATGGTLAAGATTTVKLRVTVDAGFMGSLGNQASITAAGQLGAPSATTSTDGDPATPGASSTVLVVDQCATNAQCGAPTSVCATDRSPATCVGCLADNDCGNATSGLVCDTTTEICQAGCRGANGNGCADGLFCSSTDTTIGACDHCLTSAHCTDTAPVCSPTLECVACTANTDCAGRTSGEICNETTGACVACLTDSDCVDTASPRCDTTAHACVHCLGAECDDAGAPEDGGTSPDASTADAGSTPRPDAGAPTPGDSDVGAGSPDAVDDDEYAGGGAACDVLPGAQGSGLAFASVLAVAFCAVRRRSSRAQNRQ